jgi:hypothetical protein
MRKHSGVWGAKVDDLLGVVPDASADGKASVLNHPNGESSPHSGLTARVPHADPRPPDRRSRSISLLRVVPRSEMSGW